MLYIQSLIVYLTLLIGMTATSQFAIDQRKPGLFLFPVLLFSIAFGLRYGVGIDFYAYLKSFSASYEELESYYEPGLVCIIKLCRNFGLGSNTFFFLLAFIQILFLYLSFRDNIAPAVFLPSSLIFTGIAMAGYMNNIRQTIALCIFAFAVHYISNRRFLLYILFIALAFLFHKSAVILLPLYFIWAKKDSYFHSIPWQIILATVAFMLALIIDLPSILNAFSGLLEVMGYARYLDSDRIAGDAAIGVGYIMTIVLYIIIIVYSKRMKQFYASRTFNIMYDLFYIGVLCEFLFRGSMMLNRITYYFNGFKTLFIAFILYFLYKNRKQDRMIFYSYIIIWVILIITFIRCMVLSESNTMQFVFSFQKDLYQIKQMQFNNVF